MSESEDDSSKEHDDDQSDYLEAPSKGDLEDHRESDDEAIDAGMSEIDESGDDDMNEMDESDDENLFQESDQENEISDDQQSPDSSANKDKYWEDIYGRTRDSHGNIITPQEVDKSPESQPTSAPAVSNKYIPPAMRAKMGSGNEKLLKLKKQIKGLLNRLAESNMHSICRQLEQLYSCNSRNDMNECLSGIIDSSILASSGTASTPER